jgi:hypothetical protein
MTIWTASVGEILELSAEAVICSANPQLNLSGGVGGGSSFCGMANRCSTSYTTGSGAPRLGS